ncbi:Rhs element Vgr protein, partial [mine drainage metagenome]
QKERVDPMPPEEAGHLSFALSIEGFSREDFSVVDFSGREAMNELFSFRIRLVSEKQDIDPGNTLGRPVTFRIESSRDGTHSTTPYHGTFSEFRVLHQATPYTFYEAVLVPRAHILTRSRISEVFTSEKGIPDILEDVLKGEGFSSQDYSLRMRESYRGRSFVCQFEESGMSFIDRWAEREGITYYFDHEDKKDRLVLFDHPSYKPAWNKSLSYRPSAELDVGFSDDSLQEWSLRVVPVPHRVVVSDFNYRKANLEIEENRILDSRG